MKSYSKFYDKGHKKYIKGSIIRILFVILEI